MRRSLRWLRWFGLLPVLLLIAGAGGYFYLRRSLPQIEGTIKVPGLRAPVKIVRDVDGVPHIYGDNKLDLFFGLGYVHAQDRLWQMEFQRRVGQGRLSELLGASTLNADRFLRTLGVRRAAVSAWEKLPAETREAVNAYTAGVNAFLAEPGSQSLPPEFTILRLSGGVPGEIEPWTGPDVLTWAKMMAWDLGGNYSAEILRNDLTRAVGAERAAQLLPAYPDTGPTIMTETAAGDYTPLIMAGEEIRALLGVAYPSGEGLGSNNWVVDGSKSTTGKPLLADDPHLGTRVPSIWYLAHLSGDGFNAIGATLPGVPGIVIGRNDAIAWGVTNLGPDVQDLFRERLDSSGRMAEFQGQMEPMTIITETIKVRGAPDVNQMVRITRHGPLISDAMNANNAALPADEQRQPLEPLAFRWTALDADDPTIVAFLAVNEAQNWEQFTSALRNYVAPAQNFVYADREGNIGYYAPGRIPVRAGGDGTLPAEGWSGAHEWIGWVPYEELPQSFNPPEHFIVTANNRPVPADYPHFLGRDWAARYRAERISELLRAKEQLSPNDFAAIQADQVSLLARELTPKLLKLVTPRNNNQLRAVALLQSWDGNTRGDSAAAAIFQAWFQRLPSALIGDDLSKNLTTQYIGRFSFMAPFVSATLADRENPWCDTTSTAERENCAMLAETTLQAALDELTQRQGVQIESWRWDRMHVVAFPHQPFDQVAPLKPLFSRSIAQGGDWSTVNFGPFSLSKPFEQTSIPGYRQIIDMADADGSRFIQAIGQSGNLLSPHYDDFLADWQAVRYRPMRFQPETVRRHQQATLRLIP
jgi:penicillin G amidase